MTVKLDKHDWVVRPVSRKQARHLVQLHHYAKDYASTNSYIHGLMRREDDWLDHVWGVTIWQSSVSLMRRFGVLPLTLARLVIEPSVPSNGASFLLRHSMRLIDRERWPVLVTYADTAQGHTGAIYRATGWTYDGMGGALMYVDPQTGIQRSSLDGRGHFFPCPPGWQTVTSKKHRFIHAAAASSDAAGIQPDEGGSQPTPPLQLWETA